MKIQVVNDYHFEFIKAYGITNKILKSLNCKCDVLVIAGDLNVGDAALFSLKYLRENHVSDPYIIYIPGNHEYYRSSKEFMDKKLLEYKYTNMIDMRKTYILNNEFTYIDGVLFIGSTGWWDESNGKITYNHLRSLNDFSLIHDIMNNNYGIKWGKESREFFIDTLEAAKRMGIRKVVCISHNGPTKKCAKKYQGSSLNTLFQNDWKDIIQEYQPNYWIFGHTHEYLEYRVNNTKCICNPVGYPFGEDLDNKFNPCKVVKI